MAAEVAPFTPDSPREHLIQVALDLIASEGIESLSLRRVARRAGVSHGAPLRHFESLSDLRAEVAAHGFRLLSRSIEQAAAKVPANRGPLAKVRKAGIAYVHIAVDHPGLFALMFRPDWLRTENPRFQVDSLDAFEQLALQVAAAQESGWQHSLDTRLLAGVIWSHVHGLATLWSQGALLGPVPKATLKKALDLSLDLMLSSDQQTLSTK